MNMSKVPDWAAGLLPSVYDMMVAGIETDLRRRGMPFEWHGGSVEVDVPEHGKVKLGTSSLVRAMIQGAPEQWHTIIDMYLSAIDDTILLMAHNTTLDKVRSDLRISLTSDRGRADGAIDRTFAAGLRATVVIDQPSTMTVVTREMVEKWGADTDDLFRIATANTEAMPMMAEVKDIGGLRIEVVHNDSCYAAAMGALSLPKLVPDARLGALVGMPDRDNMAFHQVVGVQSVAASQVMVAMTVSTFVRSQHALIETPYWWHDGVFEQFARVPIEDKIAMMPPRGLLYILGIGDISPAGMASKAPGAGTLLN